MATVPTTTSNRLRPEHFERASRPRADIHVGDMERWLALVAGGALAIYGLRRGTLGGLAAAVAGGGLVYRGLSGHFPLLSSLGLSTARRGTATVIPAGQGCRVEENITIQRSPQELYQFWRNLENLPRIMRHLESVRVQGDRSHWVAKGPLGVSVEWDAEVYNDHPNQMIAWRSLEQAEVDNTGSVHFTAAPGGRGTQLQVVLKYNPPAGKLGAALSKLLGEDPAQQIREDLRRFKQLVEGGAISLTQGATPGSTR